MFDLTGEYAFRLNHGGRTPVMASASHALFTPTVIGRNFNRPTTKFVPQPARPAAQKTVTWDSIWKGFVSNAVALGMGFITTIAIAAICATGVGCILLVSAIGLAAGVAASGGRPPPWTARTTSREQVNPCKILWRGWMRGLVERVPDGEII